MKDDVDEAAKDALREPHESIHVLTKEEAEAEDRNMAQEEVMEQVRKDIKTLIAIEWNEGKPGFNGNRLVEYILKIPGILPDIEELKETITYLEEAIQVMPECLEEGAKREERERIINKIETTFLDTITKGEMTATNAWQDIMTKP